MKKTTAAEAAQVAPQFSIDGELLGVVPYERGHIHNTFISTWRQEFGIRRYLHQQLNDHVFTDIPALMHNIESVTRHVRRKIGMLESAHGFRTLRLVPTRAGGTFLTNAAGPWRTYRYIENTETFDHCESEKRAFETARAFGQFQAWLADLDPALLGETIPRFFNSPYRFHQFEQALTKDAAGRAAGVAREIEFAQLRHPMVYVIEDHVRAGVFPLRIVHGDTKLNNVLFDRATGKVVSIVDLDTCMPAYSLYDFGDLVRFTAATSAEDETDLDRAGMDLGLYAKLVAGYLSGADRFLTPAEIELMPFSARLVTFTVGLRFLTDYLAGDVYFKISRPEQNLDRARVQFRMVECMERIEQEMAASVRAR